ncbi:hypothetical protein UPYG_G00222780 [Umbra pygmaea]|uniref:C-type lectin domain-containing protein n=1 Tax=Umbra pygmaea TaxID=75934 RepID=A0ABD0WCT0_UMBPY
MDNSEIYTENEFDTDAVPFSHGQKPVREEAHFQQYRLVALILGLLSTLLLVAAIILGVYCYRVSKNQIPQYQNLTQLSSTVQQFRMAHSNEMSANKEAQTKLFGESMRLDQQEKELENQRTNNKVFEEQIVNIRKENTQLQLRITSLAESCGQCLVGWDLLNSTCYYFAISEEFTSRSWEEARKECLRNGADLVVIDSWEEQDFINKAIQALRYSSRNWHLTGFWIGLKDDEKEGSWKWQNGNELTHGYWAPGEPNDYRNIEDCAAIYPKNHPSNTWDPKKNWNDAPCSTPLKWICEH